MQGREVEVRCMGDKGDQDYIGSVAARTSNEARAPRSSFWADGGS